MSEDRRVGDLQINQDLDFQRRTWAVQRVAWAVMLLVLAAAVAGLVGPGPLSEVTVGAADAPLRLEYNRFERYQAPAELRLHLKPAAAGEARVWLSQEFVGSVEIDEVTPEPAAVEAAADRLTYVFRVADASRPVPVTFRFEANAFGPVRGAVGLDGGPQLEFPMFVYP
jgi:hypothetical protein